ncbi:tetratricopeptide repeat protein [Photobacterium ganghwense]|uniref:tetratricopeptide repeat protein n=1 Tax=Photobacterium ganghwense TaxID=320778 RepID=UPI001C2D8CDB|nr:tetratricopeptide repeat protein [Photobacterium ganghwense]MBV1842347.1 tetratricopeptide repeat protein [Photobacterium ganghwense]
MSHSYSLYVMAAMACTMAFMTMGCSNSDDVANKKGVSFEHELYDGKPTLGLSNDFPPESPEEAIQRGDKAYLAHEPDLALFEYIRALSFPSQKHADQAYYKIGYIHQQRRNHDLAKLAYSRASLIEPENIQYAASLGIIELKMGESDTARKHLIHTVQMDQKRQGNTSWEPQHDLFASSLKLDTSSPLNAYVGLGILADLDARHNEAQRIYRSVLQVDNRSHKAMTNLGYSYYLAGNLNEAEAVNRRAATLYPNDKRAWSNLGLTYIKSRRYEDALDSLSRAMPRQEALNDIGYFSMLEGDYEAAVDYLERAVNESPMFYAKAQENLKRARKLQIQAPPVKLSGNYPYKSQATVYNIADTSH